MTILEYRRHDFHNIHHERQRWSRHVFPSKVVEANCSEIRNGQAVCMHAHEGATKLAAKGARTVFCHEIFLRVIWETTCYEPIATVRMLSWKRQIKHCRYTQSRRARSKVMLSSIDCFGGRKSRDYSLLELLSNLVVLHQSRRRPHHPQDAIGYPVGMQSKNRRVCLGQRSAFAATFAFCTATKTAFHRQRFLPFASFDR